MGNCQATEAATVVIQHPGGKVDRLYWPTTAAEVMRSNPGHYVALVTMYVSEEKQDGSGTSRLTRVRLLRPKEMLLLGQVYRLITSQEVTKALRTRKQEKMMSKTEQRNRTNDKGAKDENNGITHDSEHTDLVIKHDIDQQKSNIQSTGRIRQWRPSLHSISETSS